MSVAKLQRIAVIVAVASAVLGLGASTGCVVVPKGPPQGAWVLHPIVLLVGGAGGYLTVLRKRQIDAERWRVVGDPQLTTGEREYAHREAERDIRLGGTAFLLAAVCLGYWMAYQFNVEEEVTVADFLIVTPVAGYLVGLLAALQHLPDDSQPP